MYVVIIVVFFFKQKTAYDMRISDWSSDVCSSDLLIALAMLVEFVERPDRDMRSFTKRVGVEKVNELGPGLLAYAVEPHERRGIEVDTGGVGCGQRLDKGLVILFAVERRGNDVHVAAFGDRKSTRLNSSH